MTDGPTSTMTLAETIHGIVCQVCNKRFSGRIPANQHLQSETHQRKVRLQEHQSTHRLWCSVCSLLCNSQQQYDAHCDSPRHLHMIAQLDIIKKQQILTATQLQQTDNKVGEKLFNEIYPGNKLEENKESLDAVGVSGELYSRKSAVLSNSPRFVPEAAPSSSMSSPSAIPPGGVYFEDNRGHCYVCGIELTSLQHKTQHVEGKQHKKKALAFGSGGGVGVGGGDFNEGAGVMMCAICRVPLSGELNVQQHFSSPKHKARKMEHDHRMAMSGANSQYTTPNLTADTGSSSQPLSSAALSEAATFSQLHGPLSLPGRQISFPGHASQSLNAMAGQFSQPALNSPQDDTPAVNIGVGSPESLKFEWMPSKGKGICQMCDQQFQSLEEVSQHLGSAEHRQREEDIKKQSCDICQVQYSGPVSASQHLNSEKHKRHVLCSQLATSSNPAVPDLSSSARMESGLTSTFSQLSQKMSETYVLEEMVRNLGIGNSCDQTHPKTLQNVLSNLPPPTQNLPGSKVLNALDEGSRPPVPLTQYNIPPSEVENHQQEASVLEYVFDGSRGVCNVCKIDFTSRSHAESHLAGAKHQKTRLRWQQTAAAAADFGTQAQGSGMMQTAIHVEMAADTENPNLTTASDSTRGNQAYRFDGNRGYCFACKIELTSDAHANQHLVGKKHQTAAERWVSQGEPCKYPLYCDVCYKPFTGQESAAQHFSSDKHKKKVMLSEGAAVGKRDPYTGALLILRDGQMWYLCETCKCPLNTPEQYRLHVNSPRHNAEAEKAKKQDHSNRSSPIDAADVTRLSSARSSPDPSDLQHLVTRSSVKTTPGVYRLQPQHNPFGNAGLVNTERGGLGAVRTEFGTHASNTVDPVPGLQNHTRLNPGNGSAFTPIVSYSENGSVFRGENGSSHSQGSVKDGKPSASNAFPLGMSSQVQALGNSSSLQQDGFMNRRGSQNQGHGGAGQRFAEGVYSDVAQNLPIRQTPRGSAGSHGSRSAGQVLRYDGDYEEEEDNTKRLPVSSSTSDYQDHHGENEQGEGSVALSSVHGGDRLSQTEQERRLADSVAASTTSDNLTSLHTDPGSLAATGMLRPIPEVLADQQLPPPIEPSPFKGFRYGCSLCRQPMNTKEDYDRHMKGLKHQMKAATVSAPDKRGELLIKQNEVSYDEAYRCCKTMPRTYQVELMQKAMASDSTVVYLPTGTGKTLAAMMTLSRMLALNPRRPVLFLVDKVLLVLQQARYIINELGTLVFHRPHLTEDNKMEKRTLKVAVLCGGLSVRDGTPLWKHDVIVTTAAFCQNLLQDKVLLWANFSLVVFDEAHHCTKNHPYNKLLSEHHLSLPAQQRPKVLGLTASPAGRRTKEETLVMLKDLLRNLGGATIAIITTDIAKEQLDTYSSSARLVPICVPMTEAEMGFHEKLLSYFIRAYVELMHCSNLQQICSQRLQALMDRKPPISEHIKRFAQHLMSEPDELSEMVQLAQTARMKANTVTVNRFENIRMHVMTVGMTLLNSEDGIDFVLDDLERLFNRNLNKCFDELKDMGLPCEEIATYVNTLCDSARLRTREEGERSEVGAEGAPSSMSIFQELLGTLANPDYMNWDNEDSMALVLVRERKVAHKFRDHLKRTSFVRERDMRVAVVVGHGAGSGEGEGMNLRKQDKVLQGIKSHRYNIVVATSVAEEGVDIPECQLVVCLNPPTTVKALVQMRGRARKKDSYFVVLCSSEREKEKLEDLQKQEMNMKWAAAQLTDQIQ